MFLKHALVGGGALLASGLTVSAHAGQLTLDVTLATQKVAEYHKPYVAGWIETTDGAAAGNVFVWYDVKKPNGGGQKWLKELRTWWRKSGRDLTLPVDGLTGATHAPGRQTLTIDGTAAALKDLKPGAYTMVIEAARENGGHDLVKVPFTWNGKAFAGGATGDGELGDVKLAYKP
jgi:hypothetical protein